MAKTFRKSAMFKWFIAWCHSNKVRFLFTDAAMMFTFFSRKCLPMFISYIHLRADRRPQFRHHHLQSPRHLFSKQRPFWPHSTFKSIRSLQSGPARKYSFAAIYKGLFLPKLCMIRRLPRECHRHQHFWVQYCDFCSSIQNHLFPVPRVIAIPSQGTTEVVQSFVSHYRLCIK